MRLADYRIVESWTENDLQNLPSQETDYFEYKSSSILKSAKWYEELKPKICNAASAFWNSGGGVFIVGVDGKGVIDGGIPIQIGRQSIRDWTDQAISDVAPRGPYAVQSIPPMATSSPIHSNHVVLVIAFGESFDLPHMSSDLKHYIRAGAHTSPASHYIVEAVRARRGLRQPMLRGLVRNHKLKSDVLELAILAVNDASALEVEISFSPLPKIFEDVQENVVRREFWTTQ